MNKLLIIFALRDYIKELLKNKLRTLTCTSIFNISLSKEMKNFKNILHFCSQNEF